MRRIKEELRLYYESGLGLRQISRALSVSLATVREYLRRAEEYAEKAEEKPKEAIDFIECMILFETEHQKTD